MMVRFVIGYCLDYNEIYRDMEHICVINSFGIERFKNADSNPNENTTGTSSTKEGF